jgi:hypothetical protein
MTQPELEPYTAYISQESPANSWALKTVTPIRSLPINLAEMALYPGFMQEEAKNGYYAPVLLKFGGGADRHYPTPVSTLLLTDDPRGGLVDVASPITCYTSRNSLLNVPGNTTNFYSSRWCPMYYNCDSNCVMFTGLSEQTTLTLRVRFILERFPSDSEGQILVIATPSACYDPVALEIYSRAAQMLRAGVPFTENPAGEWWRSMLTSLGKVAAPLIKNLPIPFANTIGNGIQAALPLLENGNNRVKKKKPVVKAIAPPPRVRAKPAKNLVTNNQGRIPATQNVGKKKMRK